MKKWLVLSGGGSKGAFQAGVLTKLKELEPDLEYDGFAGISVGALNSATLSQGNLSQGLEIAHDIWFKKIKGNKSVWTHKLFKRLGISVSIILLLFIILHVLMLFSVIPTIVYVVLISLFILSFGLLFLVLFTTKSIYSSKPLQKLVYNNYKPQKTKDAGKRLIVGAVSWKTGKYESVDNSKDNIKDWILASSAFPLFLDSIKINNLCYTDGGIRDIAPLWDAIKAGATDIDIILASPLAESEIDEILPNLFSQLMRTINIMSNEILRNDLVEFLKLYPDLNIRIFMPEKSLTSNSLSFDPKLLRYMYEEGCKMASKPITPQEVYDIVSGYKRPFITKC